ATRGMVWADVNGDALPDLLVAEPESGQLTVHLQQTDGSLAGPKTYPTFIGVSDVAVANWNDGPTPEVFVLSTEERQIGLTQFDEKGRMPFPKILPLDGRPLAF